MANILLNYYSNRPLLASPWFKVFIMNLYTDSFTPSFMDSFLHAFIDAKTFTNRGPGTSVRVMSKTLSL